MAITGIKYDKPSILGSRDRVLSGRSRSYGPITPVVVDLEAPPTQALVFADAELVYDTPWQPQASFYFNHQDYASSSFHFFAAGSVNEGNTGSVKLVRVNGGTESDVVTFNYFGSTAITSLSQSVFLTSSTLYRVYANNSSPLYRFVFGGAGIYVSGST